MCKILVLQQTLNMESFACIFQGFSIFHIFYFTFPDWFHFLYNIMLNVEQIKPNKCLKDILRNGSKEELKKLNLLFGLIRTTTKAYVHLLEEKSRWIKMVQKCFLLKLYQKSITLHTKSYNKTKLLFIIWVYLQCETTWKGKTKLFVGLFLLLVCFIMIIWQLILGLNWTFWDGDQTT